MIAVLDRKIPSTKRHEKTVTCEEFLERILAGEFMDRKVQLLDGAIFEMPNPNPPHNTSVTYTHLVLLRIFSNGYVVRNQMGFPVDDVNEPMPDFAVVEGTIADFRDCNPTTAVLIVEVADSTLTIDRGKATLYARAGVPEYWIVDVNRRQLIVHRDPQSDRYGRITIAFETETVSLLAAPNANITVSEMLP
jgi:Uma2 family endonuclease